MRGRIFANFTNQVQFVKILPSKSFFFSRYSTQSVVIRENFTLEKLGKLNSRKFSPSIITSNTRSKHPNRTVNPQDFVPTLINRIGKIIQGLIQEQIYIYMKIFLNYHLGSWPQLKGLCAVMKPHNILCNMK